MITKHIITILMRIKKVGSEVRGLRVRGDFSFSLLIFCLYFLIRSSVFQFLIVIFLFSIILKFLVPIGRWASLSFLSLILFEVLVPFMNLYKDFYCQTVSDLYLCISILYKTLVLIK